MQSARNSGNRDRVEKNLERLYTLCRSNPPEAEILATETLAMARNLDDPALVGTSLCLLSRAVSQLRNSTESIDIAIRAVEVFRPLDEKEKLATALNNLGNCYRRLSKPLNAIEHYEEALEIQTSIGNRRGTAVVHNNLGLAFRDVSSYERAYRSFRQTVEISDEIDDKFLGTTALSNIADALIDQGEYQSANEYLEANLRVNREMNRRTGESFCLWELGRLRQKQGQLEDAERFLRESITLRRELGSNDIWQCIIDLANLLKVADRPQEAEEVLSDAVLLLEQDDNSTDLCLTRANLSILRIHMNKLKGEEKPLTDILALLTDSENNSSNHSLRTRALKSLSEYNEKTGNLLKALEYSRQYADENSLLAEQKQRENITRLKLRVDFEQSEGARVLLEQKTRELEQANARLQEAVDKIKSLHGMLPICARCKKIRKDDGYWEQIEEYIATHSDATFSHGICPECMHQLYPDMYDENQDKNHAEKGAIEK